MAILLGEPGADRCAAAIEADDALLISAATMAEALIVADRRGFSHEMNDLLAGLGLEVASVSEGDARRVADAYARWGKGVSPAGLNLGDCFAYALAKSTGAKLLYVGDDFARTDVASAY